MIGSVGSLDECVDMGDIVAPEYSPPENNQLSVVALFNVVLSILFDAGAGFGGLLMQELENLLKTRETIFFDGAMGTIICTNTFGANSRALSGTGRAFRRGLVCGDCRG